MATAKPKLINDLRAFRSEQHAATAALSQKRTRDFQRRTKKLFSKSELRTAAKIVGEIRAERNRANLQIGSNAEAKDALDVQVRKKLNRRLARALPGFREFESMKKAHLRDHHKSAIAQLSGPADESDHVRWGDLVATDDLSAEEFLPPFAIFDLHTVDEEQLIKHDQSFVAQSQGTMMNAFDFEHYYSPAIILEVFGLNRATPASHLVGCGINYTMPRAGRLQVSAVMQNFYSEVLYSVRDNFGLSFASLDISLNLFIAFMRGGSVLYRPTTILSTSKISKGGQITGSLSGLDGTTPYTVSGDSEELLQPSEAVQILAGSEVHIESEVDDMTTRVNAVVRWQLKRLAVNVI